MNEVKTHYETLLAPVYEWSMSRHGDPFQRGREWLTQLGLLAGNKYLDLGAGFGAHSLPLLDAGKQVTAVDFSRTLLQRLQQAAHAHRVALSVSEQDIVEFLEHSTEVWDVILCLGDTITHLPSFESVQRLLRAAASRLSGQGQLALGYRDSTGFNAQGVARFIPVAHDEHRAMQCLLEPIDDEHLRVTDIVTEQQGDTLRSRVSDYVKLRLSPETLTAWAHEVGLRLGYRTTEAGMTSLVFRKPLVPQG